MALITFILRYKSFYGENLYITGDIPELGDNEAVAMPMKYTDDGWVLSIKTSQNHFHYSYLLRNQEGQERAEKMHFRSFAIPNRYKHIVLFDRLEEGEQVCRPLLSTAFTKGIMHHEEKEISIKGRTIPIAFNMVWPDLPSQQEVSIIGNSSEMGNWNSEHAVKLNCSNYPEFCTALDANKISFPLEYKYIITNHGSHKVQLWEDGCNHYLPVPAEDADFIVVNDGRPKFPVADFKGAGVAVPVFSLRSRRSFGVGEFADLKLLADWARSTGQRIIQMLPINDTTIYHNWKDSYPYSAISVFALHPLYLNIEDMGAVPDTQLYEQLRQQLNAEKAVDYENVSKHKWTFIRKIFARDGQKTLSSQEFNTFHTNNRHWLDAYAVFCYLRDKFGTSDFSRWGDDAIFSEKRISDYCTPENAAYNEVALHMFVQFHLDKQLKAAVTYAHSIGVAMKGDIPIGVNRHSVEVWMNTRLFDCNGQAGAPPDDFSKFGQNWGFPIYNWKEMKKDDYSWWCNRLKKMAEYFDAYRIDHILGFFRIFRIPIDSTIGLLGQFCPALAMTTAEIKKFGIDFSEEMCQPYIHDDYLPDLFGEATQYVKDTFLTATGDHRYRLKKHVDTQRKIDAFISANDKEKAAIRTGLKILTCQVLFVHDANDASKLHPRIAMQQSFVFQALPMVMKEAFSKLYNNFFYVRNNDFWRKNAMDKLPALLKSTQMMVCGEDLGMVPDCVHPVMDELQILSLEIQRMPKEFGVEFGDLNKVPYLSVCTSSSHDMSTMRQWWEENPDRTQRFFNNVLREYGPAPIFCEPWICQRIIEMHLATKAMWVILPLQDWIAMDGKLRNDDTFSERINNPANPDNYWHYRMHLNLEDLIGASTLNQRIKALIKYYGR